MRSKMRILSLVAALVVALSGSAFAAHKDGSKHVAVGTITSMDNNQVVINEKVNGKERRWPSKWILQRRRSAT